jgi:hypothetical protein
MLLRGFELLICSMNCMCSLRTVGGHTGWSHFVLPGLSPIQVMLYQIVSYFYYTLFHRVVKWVLRIVTGRCELLRITMSQSSHAAKAFNIG